MRILVTGGAGFIGSHTLVALHEAGIEFAVVDNFVNSNRRSIARVQQIIGYDFETIEADLADDEALDSVFERTEFDGVIHLAGLKSVAESVSHPLTYYRANLVSSIALLGAMQRHSVFNLVFSSSATVYGETPNHPIRETAQTGVALANPYGRTKAMIEQIMTDAAGADPRWSIKLLRYFNPVGAHPSGLIGESPSGTPNNLFPYISQVAAGRRPSLKVFGTSYPTPDGTGIRDYVHVVDLARGHVHGVRHQEPGVAAFNLGTGVGTSVLEAIETFVSANGVDVPYEVVAPRPGDVQYSVAAVDKAAELLGWTARHTLRDACRDAWRWQSANPSGFQSP